MYDVLALIWHAKTECRYQKFYINKFWNRLFFKLKINKVEKIKKNPRTEGRKRRGRSGSETSTPTRSSDADGRRLPVEPPMAGSGTATASYSLLGPVVWLTGGPSPPGTFSTSLLDPSREPNLGSLSTSSTSPNPLHSTAASPAARRLIPSPQPQVGTCQRGFSPTDSPGFLPRSPLHPCFFFFWVLACPSLTNVAMVFLGCSCCSKEAWRRGVKKRSPSTSSRFCVVRQLLPSFASSSSSSAHGWYRAQSY